ncbi:uncharacterized protein LOC126661646 [Mercurialis annua]|uniref:uncharacterized protein LOC126661646 n=1 Tax=Mercurialis annua TaxID=3986 RepID=UPI00215FA0F7|nr:uncharacterized protein LOC126661646 [Mercurialis annua]
MSVTVNTVEVDDDSGHSMNSSSSTQHAWWIPKKRCKHGIEANVYTSYSEKNPGRRFYRCRFYRQDDCKYFEWFDQETPQPYKAALLNLISKTKTLETHLTQKAELELISTKNAEAAMRASRIVQTHLRQYAGTVAQMKGEMNVLQLEMDNLKATNKTLKFLLRLLIIKGNSTMTYMEFMINKNTKSGVGSKFFHKRLE